MVLAMHVGRDFSEWLDLTVFLVSIVLTKSPLNLGKEFGAAGRAGETNVSSHNPESSLEILPSGSTAVASTITNPAPRVAMLPRCWRWKSVRHPTSAEYMHIGAHQRRLGNVEPRICRERKSAGVSSGFSRAVPEGTTW
jgi:hypothetical protein